MISLSAAGDGVEGLGTRLRYYHRPTFARATPRHQEIPIVSIGKIKFFTRQKSIMRPHRSGDCEATTLCNVD
jgi:hypothetical protein